MTTPLTPIPARIKDLKGDVAQVDPSDGQALVWDDNDAAWTPGGISVTQVDGLTAALAAKADDSAVVHKTGTESITGQKTFSATNLRAGGSAYLQMGSDGSNFPTVQGSSNGVTLDTNSQNSGYSHVYIITGTRYGLSLASGRVNVQATTNGRLYIETLLADNKGAVIRGVLNQTAPYLELQDNTGTIVGGFDGSVNLRAKQYQTYATSLSAPTTVSNTAEFGYFNFNLTEGAGTLLLSLNVNGAGYAQSKLYMISTTWAASSAWRQIVPISSTGPYEGNDIELDALQETVLLRLRIRRTSGSTAATVAFSAVVFSRLHAPFTFSGATASVPPPTEIFLGTQTGGVPGNFDMGGWAKIGSSLDAAIPNRGVAWSLNTANALKCRTPDGTLKTITLT